MKYALTTEVLGIDVQVQLTTAEYEYYQQAWRTTTECLAMEDSFGYVISDMLDLESAIHRHAYDAICNPHGDWSVAMDRLHDVSRRLVHLLGSSHAYIDSTTHRLRKALSKNHPAIALWNQLRDQLADDSEEAKIWHHLRNLAVHEDNPLSGVTVRGHLTSPHGTVPVRVERTFALNINRAVSSMKSGSRHLRKDGRVTRHTLREDIPAKFDVRPLVQDYVAQLGHVHHSLREAISKDYASASAAIRDAVTRFAERAGMAPDAVYVVLATLDSQGGMESRVPMNSQWADRYASLVQRYSGVPSLRNSYLTTRSTL